MIIKNNNIKGITLISLVITIVIMLILATVSINLILGKSGLFSKTSQSANAYKLANAEEKVSLAVSASYDEETKLNDQELMENINKIDGLKSKVDSISYDLKITVDGFDFIINELGNVTSLGKTDILPDNSFDHPQDMGKEVALKEGWDKNTVSFVKTLNGVEVTDVTKVATIYAVADGAGETIPIPKGFNYVGGKVSEGAVISDNADDKYDGTTDKTSHDYAENLKGNQFVWIPCDVANYKKIKWGVSNALWDMETNKAELNQIEKYGGFYIGRYEAGVSTLNKDTNEFIDSVKFKNDASLKDAVAIQSGENSWTLQNYNFTARQNATVVTTGVNNVVGGNIVEKANSIPYYHTDYYTAVEMSTRLYSNNDYVSSGLVTGTQWDMMLKFMQDSGVNLAQPDWGNYDDVQVKNLRGYYTIVVNSGATDGFKDVAGASTQASTGTYIILTTGASEQLKKNNLYEVAGNLWEWTQEAAYVTGVQYSSSEQLNTYMLRGGAAITGKACCPYYRGFSYGPNTEVEFGFRPVLYIK